MRNKMKGFIIGNGFCLACIFVAIIIFAACGCSTQDVTPRGQTTSICAVGFPVVAWISHIDNDAEHIGSDTNTVTQANTQSYSGDVTTDKSAEK